MLPQPKQWRRQDGLVPVCRSLKVRRPARLFGGNQADQARMVDRALDGLTDLLPAAPANPAIKNKLLKHIGISIATGEGNGHDTLPAEGYRLTIGPDSIDLAGTDGPGLRAGLVTLCRLLTVKDGATWLPMGQIVDWPDLPMRGFHLDLACQSLSFDYVCSLIERMGGCKYNAMLLEYGDKFPYQGHRTLAHSDAFTPRQVAQILELAEVLGIVVIPLVQTLGHAQYILRHPQFAHLSEVPGEVGQLATANPESLVLAKQLVDQLIESHPNSPYVHLGGDETTQLGAGLSADQIAAKGKSLVWVEYMNVICRHVQARGRTPIVWDDMLLGFPQALNRFTRDCLVMHWNYAATSAVSADYHQPGIGRVSARTYDRLPADIRDRYEPFWGLDGARPPKTFYTPGPVVYLQEAGFKVILAGSVRSYGDSYAAPRVRQHIDNCVQMAKAANELRCLGLMVTNWSVRRTPLETTVPGLLAAAEAAWNASRGVGSLDALLASQIAVGRTGELIKTMEVVGRHGSAMLNGVGSTNGAWDRRHERWGISPLLARMRKADLVSLTDSAGQVKLARAVQREARSALTRLARATAAPGMHPSFMNAWRYAARETGHKAGQWLYLWQVSRMVRADRGSVAALARAGSVLLEEMRRCMREFKRAVGPSLAGSGLEEELDVRFGGEARLVRRIVRTLRAKLTRTQARAQLAEMLGLPAPVEK